MNLRDKLKNIALEWQRKFGIAPAITSTISEYDAAMLIDMSEDDYSNQMQTQTAVQKGHDFVFNGHRYQIKANRPSGKPGSKVTLVPKAKNYEWDYLIWLHYTTEYEIQEAWMWPVQDYVNAFDDVNRLSPSHYREGINLLAERSS